MPTFVTRQQTHRAFMRRSDPTRREPGLLDSVLKPVVSNVVNPIASDVVAPVANKVVTPVVKKIVNPIVSSIVEPVVAPIIAPLTQGAPAPPTPPPPVNTPPTLPPPVNTPPPTTTPSGGSSGSNNGNGNGGGSGNGNGNGDGNGSGNNGGGSGGSSGGNGHGGSGGTGGGSGGTGGDSGGTGGDSGGTGGGSEVGSGTGSGAGSNSGDGSPSTSGGGGSSGSTDHAQGVAGTGSDHTPTGTAGASGTSPSSGSNFLTTGDNVPVNAGSDPNSPSANGNTHNPGTGSTAFIPGPSGIGTPGTAGNGNNNGGISDGGVHGNGGSSQKGGLSKGAAAGIAIAVIFVVGLVLFLIVRRQRKNRNARQKQWWFNRNRVSATYNDGVQPDIYVGPRRSVRSSFETTVDHSQTHRLDLDFEVPSLPPMAQLRRDPVLINLDTSAIGPQVTVTGHDTPNTPSRFSIGTTSSIASSELGQWLIVSPNLEGGQTSPMSVRPFSPTEAFSFPKPPRESSGTNYSSQAQSRRGTIQGLPSLPASNPFDDPDSVVPLPAVKIQKVPSPINVAAPNPFADPLPKFPPEPNTPSAVHPEFMEVEVVKRPFYPTLSDEILVEVGDDVKILQMFDDGWSLVEKNPMFSDKKKPQIGLIPIDCFRSVGQGVNEFIASKRVSSYSQTSTPVGLY